MNSQINKSYLKCRGLAALLLAVGLAQFAAVSAQARGVLLPTLLFRSSSLNENGAVETRSQINSDVRLAYAFENGLLLGATYSFTSGAGTNSYALTQSAIGPALGFYWNRWVFDFIYYVTGNHDETFGGNTYKYGEGAGYQLDVHYLIPVANSVQIGPSLGYRSLTFKSKTINGLEAVNWSYTQNDFLPYAGLLFLF